MLRVLELLCGFGFSFLNVYYFYFLKQSIWKMLKNLCCICITFFLHSLQGLMWVGKGVQAREKPLTPFSIRPCCKGRERQHHGCRKVTVKMLEIREKRDAVAFFLLHMWNTRFRKHCGKVVSFCILWALAASVLIEPKLGVQNRLK